MNLFCCGKVVGSLFCCCCCLIQEQKLHCTPSQLLRSFDRLSVSAGSFITLTNFAIIWHQSLFVCWCFEPSQPQRITSGLMAPEDLHAIGDSSRISFLWFVFFIVWGVKLGLWRFQKVAPNVTLTESYYLLRCESAVVNIYIYFF